MATNKVKSRHSNSNNQPTNTQGDGKFLIKSFREGNFMMDIEQKEGTRNWASTLGMQMTLEPGMVEVSITDVSTHEKIIDWKKPGWVRPRW